MQQVASLCERLDALQTEVKRHVDGTSQRELVEKIRLLQRAGATEASSVDDLLKSLSGACSTIIKFSEQCQALRDRAEDRIGSSAARAIPDILDDIFHDRELTVRDVSNATEHRSEESARLDRDIAQLEDRAEAGSRQCLQRADECQAALSEAFAAEMARLRRLHAAAKQHDKEISYHAKRGTLVKRSTKLTPAEEALQRRVQDMVEEVTQLRGQQRGLEAETGEIGLQAGRGLEQMTSMRLRHKEALAARRGEQATIRTFLNDLRAENEQWIALRNEMLVCIRGVQRRIRGAAQ
jgi:hypothetical protein